MKPYAPSTNKGRTVAADDIHHRTADLPSKARKAAAKAQRKSARRRPGEGRDFGGLDDTFFPIPGYSSAGDY